MTLVGSQLKVSFVRNLSMQANTAYEKSEDMPVSLLCQTRLSRHL